MFQDSDTVSVFYCESRLKTYLFSQAILSGKGGDICLSKIGCLNAVASPRSFFHTGLLMARWPTALCPRVPSCLCYPLAVPFSFAVIASSES